MKQVILLIGPPGSGKTTLCKTLYSAYTRVSGDDMGKHLHIQMFEALLKAGQPLIIVDKMNTDKVTRRRFLEPAKEYGYQTGIMWLDVSQDICFSRLAKRTEHKFNSEELNGIVILHNQKFQAPDTTEADFIYRITDV